VYTADILLRPARFMAVIPTSA